MPHVILKMYAGRTDEQKRRLATALTKAVMSAGGASEDSISVAIEDVAPAEWFPKVYEPEIAGKPELIFKKPGYGPR